MRQDLSAGSRSSAPGSADPSQTWCDCCSGHDRGVQGETGEVYAGRSGKDSGTSARPGIRICQREGVRGPQVFRLLSGLESSRGKRSSTQQDEPGGNCWIPRRQHAIRRTDRGIAHSKRSTGTVRSERERFARVVTPHLGSVRSANDCVRQGGRRANHQAYSRDRRLAEPLQPLNGGSMYWATSRALLCTPRCPHHRRKRLAGAQARQGCQI